MKIEVPNYWAKRLILMFRLSSTIFFALSICDWVLPLTSLPGGSFLARLLQFRKFITHHLINFLDGDVFNLNSSQSFAVLSSCIFFGWDRRLLRRLDVLLISSSSWWQFRIFGIFSALPEAYSICCIIIIAYQKIFQASGLHNSLAFHVCVSYL